MEHWFYHLEQTSLEAALPTLLEKSLANDWRAVIRFDNAGAMRAMDGYLWTYKDDSFLPHGTDEKPWADAHPILLTCEDSATADVIFLIGSAQPGDTSKASRCITMVDSRDDAGRAAARERWKAAKDAGGSVSYWRQDDRGSWKKQG